MTERTTAFVLSGGGAKGSFSAGALDYLIRELGITPSILTGTSAGALCAGILAQARTPAEFYAVAGQLRDDIIRMSVSGAAFAPQPWLGALDGTAAGDDIQNLVKGRTRAPIPPDPTSDVDVLADATPPELTLRQGWEDLKSLVTTVATQRKALHSFAANNRSIMVLDPLATAFQGKSPGMGPSPVDEAAVARPGVQLRLTVTALQDACIRYVTESGALVEIDGVTPAPGAPTPGVIEGMLASSSVPMVFEPRKFGDDVYVDGGVLENIPLEPAVHLGAQDVFVVLADPLSCPPPKMDYAQADMFNVLLRSESEVAFYDQQRRDLLAPQPAGNTMTLIDPTLEVVSTFETEAALLAISMDYGWLRACGETSKGVAEHRGRARELADHITIGRVRAWYLQQGEGGAGDAHDKALASAQALTRDSMAEWRTLGLALPGKSDSWCPATGSR
jgi:predicted acylesterase/phospholipase RssA